MNFIDFIYVIFVAWLQVSHGNADVVAMIRTPTGDFPTGWIYDPLIYTY